MCQALMRLHFKSGENTEAIRGGFVGGEACGLGPED